MIPGDVDIFVALDPINMQLGFDRLAGLVEERLHRDPRAPALYIFFNRRRTLVKVLFADASGLCVFYKRLDRGRYQVPEPRDDSGVIELSEDALNELLDGMEVTQSKARRPTSPLH